MTRVYRQNTPTTALDGRVAGLFNTVTLVLAGLLLFVSFVPA